MTCAVHAIKYEPRLRTRISLNTYGYIGMSFLAKMYEWCYAAMQVNKTQVSLGFISF